MSQQYKYQLDKSSKKFNCPQCGKKKFVRYINMETKEYLPETIGRCDRENSCTYHVTPKQFFAENDIKEKNDGFRFPTPKRMETGNLNKPTFLPFDILDKSVTTHSKCDLFPYLASLFSEDVAHQLCLDYFIGSNKKHNTVFWQVDINGNIRQAKVIPYLPDGHRDKNRVLKEWTDKETGELVQIKGAYAAGKEILRSKDVNLQSCFFGEYLLADDTNHNKVIAIVESEKTAVIASVYYPQFLWLATGGKTGCKWTEASVCKVLSGRKVLLFPDLGGYDAWKVKAGLLAAVGDCKVAVSDILEISANDEQRKNGLDIADFLIKRDPDYGWALAEYDYPVFWDYR